MIRPESFRTGPSLVSGRVVAQATTTTPNAMGTFSTYLATGLLNHAFVATHSFVPPPTVYVALYTANPTAAGGGTEVAGDPNYTRLAITFGAASGTPATVQNSAQVSWPVATVNWGLIFSAGLLDAATGGNLMAYGLMLTPDGITATPKLVNAGDVFLIGVGAFIVGLV
jgi:hypothetical protein